MKKVLVFVVSCSLLLFALSSFSSSFAKEPTAQAKTLKIGLIASLTGPMAPAFKDLADAAKPVADLMNQRGGVTIKGQQYRFEIVTEDDQSSPPGAVAAVNRLIQAGIKFIIPPLFIPSNMAITPITEEA